MWVHHRIYRPVAKARAAGAAGIALFVPNVDVGAVLIVPRRHHRPCSQSNPPDMSSSVASAGVHSLNLVSPELAVIPSVTNASHKPLPSTANVPSTVPCYPYTIWLRLTLSCATWWMNWLSSAPKSRWVARTLARDCSCLFISGTPVNTSSSPVQKPSAQDGFYGKTFKDINVRTTSPTSLPFRDSNRLKLRATVAKPEVELQPYSEHDREAPPVAISSELPEHTLPDNVDVHNAASRAEPSPPPSATLGDASDISSYFPPVEEVAAQASSRPRRTRAITDAHPPYVVPSNARPQSTTSPTESYPAARANPLIGAGQHTMYAPGSYPTAGPIPGIPYSQPSALPTPSPATVSVPPLDPSMPLPDTLASLHSSLVTLAGALGALAAARGSDALRTTEELRGLRTAMHALRMQVHDILTARTHLASQGPGGAVGGAGDGDAADAPPLGHGAPPWPIYGPRPHGYPAMYPHAFPPPQLGVPHQYPPGPHPEK
ncbi:hypothetical protein BN946_scf185037.g19 [Trametes cinnabarina]|uniref:Uncharacterized protein n=1 Tax=Pycnoporus cinnabarinus TaxID=5643 RepID=A0A060SPU9_PYCCI|nr:hypothetical protein BN946_scf185037.g19 [Trametes cinnabarina]